MIVRVSRQPHVDHILRSCCTHLAHMLERPQPCCTHVGTRPAATEMLPQPMRARRHGASPRGGVSGPWRRYVPTYLPTMIWHGICRRVLEMQKFVPFWIWYGSHPPTGFDVCFFSGLRLIMRAKTENVGRPHLRLAFMELVRTCTFRHLLFILIMI